MRLEIDQKLVDAVSFIVQKGIDNKKNYSKEYIGDLKEGKNTDKKQLLIEIVKEALYQILENNVIKELKIGGYLDERSDSDQTHGE